MANVRGVLPNLETAWAAIAELRHAGFREHEIGLDAIGEGDDGIASGHGDHIALTITADGREPLARDLLASFGAADIAEGAFPTQEIGTFDPLRRG